MGVAGEVKGEAWHSQESMSLDRFLRSTLSLALGTTGEEWVSNAETGRQEGGSQQ